MLFLTTDKGINLAISNIAKKTLEESRQSAEFRFKQRVGNAKVEDRLKVINENSKYTFEQITENNFVATDVFGNDCYLIIK